MVQTWSSNSGGNREGLPIISGQHRVGLSVRSDVLGFGIERQRAAQPVRRIGHVAQRCRNVTLQDVAVQIAPFAAANRLEEILDVRSRAPSLPLSMLYILRAFLLFAH